MPDVNFVEDDSDTSEESEPDEWEKTFDQENPEPEEEVSSQEEEQEEGPSQAELLEKLQKQVDNLNKALKESRVLKKTETDALRKRIDDLTSNLEKAGQKDEIAELLEELEDEDLVTVAATKKIIASQKKALEGQFKEVRGYVAGMLVSVAEEAFRQTHPDYDEVVAPYLDLILADEDLKKEVVYNQGPAKVPERLYKYAKKQLAETEAPPQTKETQKPTEEKPQQKPLQKPRTMGAKSSTGDKTKVSELSLEEKRKLIKQGKLPMEALMTWEETVE